MEKHPEELQEQQKGRALWWDKPAQTIKRECSHVGNGRYAHPEENRLCTVREIAALQGFPDYFVFNGAALSNMYRQIGDAVPPLISYQLAHLACWNLTEELPQVEEIILPGTHLTHSLAILMKDCYIVFLIPIFYFSQC